MKKPITHIDYDNANGLHVSGLYGDEIEDAYNEMIDALIETRNQLTIALSHEESIPTKVLTEWCTKVEKALLKAGCTDEV